MFDVVCSIQSLSHVLEWQLALEPRMRRILKLGLVLTEGRVDGDLRR